MNCWTNSSTNSIWKKRGCIDALCGIWGVGKSLPCATLRSNVAGRIGRLGTGADDGSWFPKRGKMAWGLLRSRAYGLVTLTRMNFCDAAVTG